MQHPPFSSHMENRREMELSSSCPPPPPPPSPSVIDLELRKWITDAGGHIHPHIECFDTGVPGSRGIRCKAPISRESLLIRIPSSLVLNSEPTPASSSSSSSGPNMSPWLRCLAQLLEERKCLDMDPNESGGGGFFRPYLRSLPTWDDPTSMVALSPTHPPPPYDDDDDDDDDLGTGRATPSTNGRKRNNTTIGWSTEEVRRYLGGTCLGKEILRDRTDGVSRRLYRDRVRPLLRCRSRSLPCGTGSSEKSDGYDYGYGEFVWASHCLSTRGFHRSSSRGEGDHTIGPLLIPYVDLINHHDDDDDDDDNEKEEHVFNCENRLPPRRGTSLRYYHSDTPQDQNQGSSSYYFMVAERDLAAGEELLHSYRSGAFTDANVNPTCHALNALNALNVSPGFTAAELLRTYGYVSRSQIRRQTLVNTTSFSDNAITAEILRTYAATDAVISRFELKEACLRTARSKFVREKMAQEEAKGRTNDNNEDDDDDDDEEDERAYVWDPLEDWAVKEAQVFGNKKTLNPATTIETEHHMMACRQIDEVVTTCILLLLPEDALREMIANDDDDDNNNDHHHNHKNGNNEVLTLPILDADQALEDDPWLRTLVASALRDLVRLQVRKYTIGDVNENDNNNDTIAEKTSLCDDDDDDIEAVVSHKSGRLRSALELEQSESTNNSRINEEGAGAGAGAAHLRRKRMEGWTVQLEELGSLQALHRLASRWWIKGTTGDDSQTKDLLSSPSQAPCTSTMSSKRKRSIGSA